VKELKTCPFCGGFNLAIAAGWKKIPVSELRECMYKVKCNDCHPDAYHDTEDLAIEAWNKRS